MFSGTKEPAMSEFKSCPVCQEETEQCLTCASYVVDGERIYYEKLKDFGATQDYELRFIQRIQKHRTTAFFHKGNLYIPSRQGRSVPLAIGLQWEAWQEQQAKVEELKATIKGNHGRIAELERLNRVKAQTILDLHQEIKELKASHHGEVIGHEVHLKKIKQERDELQKRVDAVIIEIENMYLSGAIGFDTVKKLEQALKGEG